MPHAPLPRRRFLEASLGGCALAAGAGLAPGFGWLERALGLGSAAIAAEALESLLQQAPVARYWTSTATAAACDACHGPTELKGLAAHEHVGVMVRCELCARRCQLGPGERGLCGARINIDGQLRSLVYGRPITTHVDPIEKKPFYHFLPGSQAFSLATSGCPLRCRFCQNWEISQAQPEDYHAAFTPPGVIVRNARTRTAPIIAYTYNEPTVFLEYLTDIARAGREVGLRSVLISCGYASEAAMGELCDVLDAVKIDLKGFSDEFYRQTCGAELAPVLASIKRVHRRGLHLELVNLVVPSLNDSDDMQRALSHWVVTELGPDVPIHFTRVHPDYQLNNLPPTPVETLERARQIAMDEGVRFAYVGNVPGHPGNDTCCPKCGATLIERRGFLVEANNLKEGRCGACGEGIAGVWA
ncbi:MAG: AmmeMemoRadiSam system radical SAM enzyme [Pseudomonadota bacterium]